MSRLAKWKLEKTKVKVVFRLQFHATHIPQSGWDKLFISFIPADSGKPSAKTTKANVRNGNCKWADPIYETTRLLQDSKTKQYDEKLYKIVVAMGSSRSSTLGEATINLADFVDALKPSAITLPLHGCNFGTALHITVQLLTSKTGFREFEQQRELRETGLQSGVDGYGHSATGRTSHSDEVSARIKLKADASELSLLEEEANLNEEYGVDGSSNTSGSLYAEKHDASSTHENDSTPSVDLHGQSPCRVKEDQSDHQSPAQGTSGSAHGWGSDNSINNELAMACEENNRLRGSLESAESSFFNLKLEVSSLQNLADELGAETQKLSYELSAEISSAVDLAKDVSAIKSECVQFKDDINKLKDLKVSPQISSVEFSDSRVNHLVSVVEGKIRELQKKAYDGRIDHLELEPLLNFLLDFKLGNGQVTSSPVEREDVKEIRELGREPFLSGLGLGLDLCQPESVLHHFSTGPPVSEVGAIDAMKGQIFDLVRELDEAKVEKEALIRKMNHMECYYEALIHELEENQKRLVGELQHLTNEHSTCLYALSVSKTETESLREDMKQQMLHFVEERHELEDINKELERRATTSEAALRRARLNYSIAVDKLQKDLELLSSQVFSMFETNENLIKQALPSQPDSQVDRGLQQNSENDDITKSLGLRKRSVGGDVILEDLKRSFLMQEELYQKVQEELVEMYSINMNLDIYSKTLEQSLCEADADMRIMKEGIGELVAELELSTSSQNRLMVRLQNATDEIHSLNEFKSSSISQCGDMALQNQILEEKLVSIFEENALLNQKIAELSLQLKQEALENENLMNESSHLKEKLMTLIAETDELVFSKGKLEENIEFVQDRLVDLLSSYTKQFSLLANCQNHNLDIKDAILQLEEIQHNACLQNRQLIEENQNLKSEKADADVSLSALRSEIQTMKQKFQSGVLEMAKKLDVSSFLVDKLQAELESVSEKVHLSSEIEEKFAQQNEILLADLALLEDQMQELTSRNGLLGQEFSGLDSLAEELMHDKEELALHLQEKTGEYTKLSFDNNRLKESLETLRIELRDEKAYKDELEEKVRDLAACLSKNQDRLREFDDQKDELLRVRKLASDLEMEKSRLTHLLGQQNEVVEKIEKNRSLEFDEQKDELMRSRELVADLEMEKSRLTHLLGQKDEVIEKLEKNIQQEFDEQKAELMRVKELASDLEVEKSRLAHLLDQQNEVTEELEKNKLQEIEEQKVELMQVRERAADLEVEKARLAHLLGQQNEVIEKLEKNKLQEIEEQKAELMRVRELASDLEMERSRLAHLLDQQNEVTEKLEKNKLLEIEEQKAELMRVREQASDLEEEKSRLAHLLDEQYEVVKNLEKNKLLEIEEQKAEVLRVRELASALEIEKLRLAHLLDQQNEVIEKLEKNKLLEFEEQKAEVLRVTELASDLEREKSRLDHLLDQQNDVIEKLEKNKLLEIEEQKAEVVRVTELASDLEREKSRLSLLLDQQNEVIEKIEKNKLLEIEEQKAEVVRVRELASDLEKEKSRLACLLDQQNEVVENLENKFREFDEQKAELMRARELASDLDMEKSRLAHLLGQQNEVMEKLEKSNPYQVGYESELLEMHDHSLAADVRLIYVSNQYEALLEELLQKLAASEACQRELQKSLAGEANLLACLESLRSDLEASGAENKLLSESNNEIKDQLDECKKKLSIMETQYGETASEVTQLKTVITDAEEEINHLTLSKEELGIVVIVLQRKVHELFNELSRKLGEQVLKAEEFKNLSIHLKELKDKAEAEACEKRANEILPGSVQETLRIAFIKEQCDTKVQELRQQLSMSKRHGEEMLLKLQDAIDEIENRKKSEAMISKKNEELSVRLSALETELMSAISEKREKSNAYDRANTELECALLSLECCKEEKEKLGASLLEFEVEKSRLVDELSSMKEQLENLKSSRDEYLNGSTGNSSPLFLKHDESAYGSAKRGNFLSAHDGKHADSTETISLIGGESADSTESVQDASPFPESNGKNLHIGSQHLGAERLRSSIEHLHEELEKMKNENMLYSMGHDADSDYQVTQSEIMQLHKTNEELRSMFPSFNEISSGGNALDRVLALEIELAEALKTKSKSNVLFQSSFLKQHSDEEAIFKSFKDINELIKEMLELKGRQAGVEAELREMHDRYSRLSLQFAEVEGERQKLKMTLKNVRSSKKLASPIRSSSDNMMDL